MITKIVLFVLVQCVLINVSEQGSNKSDISHVRIKRAKFRYYRKPSRPEFPKGFYSYTPPPNYVLNEEETNNNIVPGKPHFNKKMNSNLNDEDINNLFNNLSKDDLNKILQFANEKEYNTINLNPFNQDVDRTTEKAYNIEFYNADISNMNNQMTSVPSPVQQIQIHPYNKNGPFASNMIEGFNNMMSDVKSQIPVSNTDYGTNEKEEILPKPVNLRDEPIVVTDYDISHTKHVPSYIKPSDGSYKVENFGRLPLSEHSSKLSSVSSYNVPHYSVISNAGSKSSASSSRVPQIEAAPSPISKAAFAESDAHLKAIKIWSHRSKGTAYTLHDDGTLSLERHKTKLYPHA